MSEHEQLDYRALIKDLGPYSPEAYAFVQRGLEHTVHLVHKRAPSSDPEEHASLHVSGRELCMGLRDYALHRYGALARTVLGRWGLRRTDDFGQIVYRMIEAEVMRKSDTDTLDDFQAVYDFAEAFPEIEG